MAPRSLTGLAGVFDKLKALWGDRAGSTAMIVGLSMPVIALAIGGAVDFSRMAGLRARMQDAADVASVGSISVNSAAYKVGAENGDDDDLIVDKSDAQRMFESNMRSEKDLANIKFSAKITKQNGLVTAKITATADYKPYILDLIGFKHLPVQVTSISTASVPPYVDFYLLLDNSPSMGLGATTADIDTMVSATAKNASDASCAFACHQMDKPGKDYYALAKKLGVKTRIDVVRQATQDLMTTAKKTQTLTSQYRVAIYDFGLSADTIDAKAPPAYQISALTSDLTASATNAAAVDLMTIPYQNYNSDRQSNFDSVLKSMNVIIPSAGDGTTPSRPQKVLFMVADGATDAYDCSYSNGGTCRRITPVATSACTAMKARGVRIAVLYTTYLPLPTNAFYNQQMAKYITPKSLIAAEMENCASPGLYFEVSPSQGIPEAMNTLFARVVARVKIDK